MSGKSNDSGDEPEYKKNSEEMSLANSEEDPEADTEELDLSDWEDYMYKTKEMNTLDVRVVNTFVKDWDDDQDYDIEKIFAKIRRCQIIMDDISSALSAYTLDDKNTPKLWKESISNLKDIIAKKLDYASFMLLKEAEQYMNDKTQNMEYGVRDVEGTVTLCLWANLHRAARRQGVEILGYDFQIPAHLVVNDCAVRIMHLAFDYVSPEVPLEPLVEEPEPDSAFIETTDVEENIITVDKIIEEEKVSNEESQPKRIENMENEEINDPDTSNSKESPVEFCAGSDSQVVKRISMDFEQLPEQVAEDDDEENMKDKSCASPDLKIIKLENHVLSLREYFAVGGILHFDLFKVPKVTIKKKGITYIYKQEPVLERIKCERIKCNSSFAIDRSTSSLVKSLSNMNQTKDKEASNQPEEGEEELMKEIDESEGENDSSLPKEIESSSTHTLESISHRDDEKYKECIKLKMRLPSNVVFFEQPQPAFFCPERRAFTTEGISNIKFYPDSREISFMPDQFGIFGMFQKKYINFPYKAWYLKSGEMVELSLTGQHASVIIQISSEGFRIESLNPTEKFALVEISSGWLTIEKLHEELLSVGLNIFVDEMVNKFLGIPSKNRKMEYDIYDHMALLSQHCDFGRSKWNCKLPRDEFVLNIIAPTEEKYKKKSLLALIIYNRTVILKHGEEMEVFSDETVESQTFSSNLFHLVHNNLQIPPPEISTRYACIENVCTILQKCSILTCS